MKDTKKTITKVHVGTLAVIAGGLLLLVMLAGCGHNSINYSDGVGFETTFRPDSGNFGFVFRYGKILSVAARENTEVEMTGEGQGAASGQNSGSASSSGSVKVKIGRQITGYYVDAIKAGAEQEKLAAYTEGGEKAAEGK